MRKISFLLTMMIASLMMLCTSCSKDTEDVPVISKPVAAFTAGSTTVEVGEKVWFTDNSTNSPTSRIWYFEGADPASSTNSKPSAVWDAAGIYRVTLIVENSDGADTLVKEDYITVEVPPMRAIFHNSLFTDIDVAVSSLSAGYSESAIIEPGNSYTFTGLEYGDRISYSAKTSGKTSTDIPIGLELSWIEINLVLNEVLDVDLSLGSDYFFLNMTNSGSGNLNNLYVNYGLSAQTNDNIILPNNGESYKVGYYKAFSNTNVRWYFESNPSSYVYWDQGVQFTLPWTQNQQANLGNNRISAGLNGENIRFEGITIEAAKSVPCNIPTTAIKKYPHN